MAFGIQSSHGSSLCILLGYVTYSPDREISTGYNLVHPLSVITTNICRKITPWQLPCQLDRLSFSPVACIQRFRFLPTSEEPPLQKRIEELEAGQAICKALVEGEVTLEKLSLDYLVL